jgi:hypothetical protein
MATINGEPIVPVKACRVGKTLDHGYAWCFTTTTTTAGQLVVVPLRDASACQLREVFLVDAACNGRPDWRERVRRWGWLARAVILRKQDA